MALDACPSCGTDFAGGSGRCGNCGHFEPDMAPEGAALVVADHPDAEIVHAAEPVTDAGTETGATEEEAGETKAEEVAEDSKADEKGFAEGGWVPPSAPSA